jgi:predicted component of type VI protein secretion system
MNTAVIVGLSLLTALTATGPCLGADALSAAESPLAIDGNLDIGTAPAAVPFMVEYPSFGPGHKVILRLAGVSDYATPAQTTAATVPLTFTIPKATITPNFGKTISITYTVEVPGAPVQTSAPFTVNVTLDTLSAPRSTFAEDGKLDVGKAPLQVPFQVVYPSLSSAHKVSLSVDGTPPYKTATQTASSSAPLTFNIPREVLVREQGKLINITYTVDIAGAPVQTSLPLPLQVEIAGFPPPLLPLPVGVNVATRLNGRYLDTRDKCDNGTPAYYCSGVVIRGTQNGNFDPWNPSTNALALGGVSFSYMRKDAYVKDVYRNSGYIVLGQQEAVAKDKGLDYLCVYAYDAWTAQPDRPDAGCGFQPRTAQAPDPSTCSQVDAITDTGWYAFISTLPKQQDQCSLSAQDPEQFVTSLNVRANRPANMPDAWNEILVKTWDQNIPEKLPLEAFFYKNASGLAEAKAYQQKYATRTGGGWLPIIKLDLARLSDAPFSYSPTDQGVQP